MVFNAKWESISRAIIMTIIISLWTNIATAGFNDDLFEAADQGDIKALISVIDDGADVNAKTDDGLTELMFASMGGHLEIVRELIAEGADVNAKTNVTALSIASIKGHQRVVELLEKAGTQVKVIPPADKPAEVTLQPTAMPVIPSIAKPVATPVASAQPIVSEPAHSDAPPSTPRAPTAEAKKLEQKRNFYTLLAGETVSRSKLDILLNKLKVAGIQPVVREEYKTTDVYRLVTECFSEGAAAKKLLTNHHRQKREAFINHDAGQFCVVVASLFSYDAALAGQNRLAKQGLRTNIIKAQVHLTSWQVTVGRYDDSQSAAVEMKSLAELGIDGVLIPLTFSP